MATSNVKLRDGRVVPMTYPDDWSTEQVEQAIHEQFPDESANESVIPETPFNGREPEPEEEMGLTGVAVDAADLLGKALTGVMKFGEEAPENLRRIKKDVGEHGLSAVGHILGQLHVGNANLGKAIINTPHDFAKYLIHKNVLGATEVPIPFTNLNLSDLIPHIPEDTGLEKALGLEAQPERGDEFTRALPGIANLAVGGFQGVRGLNRWLKSPDKMALLKQKLEQNIAGAEEAHAATQEESQIFKDALKEKYSGMHGSQIGELTPTGQKVAINIKKAKQAEKAESLAIPEKEVPEIPPKPSTEHLEKQVEDKVVASAKAREHLDESLGVLKNPTHKAGRIIKQEIEAVKANSNKLYKDARDHYKAHNILADNDEAIKSATEDLNKLKDADELAPGYGHGSEEQKSLEATLDALKTETVAASDVSALQEHAEKLAQNFRQKAYSGVSQLEHENYLKTANRIQAHADKLAKRLETVGGKDVQKIFKEARQGWQTYKKATESTVGRKAYNKGEIPAKGIIDIANTEEGHAFIKALVENDPSLRRHMLAAHIGESSVNKLLRPTEEVKKHLSHLPDLQEKIQDFKEALAEVKSTEKATAAEKVKIKDAYKDLVDSIETEAKQQAKRQAAVQEHAKLEAEIKSHEAAIPKLEARIKAEKSSASEVAKAKAELKAHEKALAEKHPRMKKLKALMGAAAKITGISSVMHKIGL